MRRLTASRERKECRITKRMIMKKNNIFRHFAFLMAGCAAFMVSCGNPAEPEAEVGPDFPASVSKTVAPGETATITFDANFDWEVSVPESTLTTFWIEDGAMDVAKVSGKAGEGLSVTIGTTSNEDFNERICKVSMKMDGKSQDIAVIVIPGKDRTIMVYSAAVADGEVQWGEDGYLYENDEASSLDLIWSGSDFRLPVKVDANYSWTVRTPSWAVVDVPEDRVGSVALNILGVPSEYPLKGDDDGTIQFMAGDEVVKEYAITIPACEDIFSHTIAMGLAEAVFNYEGLVKTDAGFVDGPVSASVYGTSGVKVFAVECVNGVYDVENTDVPSWLVLDVEEYDDSEGADVLQERQITMSVLENGDSERSAVVFFLPPGLDRSQELFNNEMTAVNDEYTRYAFSVTQLSSDQEFIMMLSSESEMANGGALFKKSEDQNLYKKFGETKYAYELVYNNQYASDVARMSFAKKVHAFKVFGAIGTDKTDVEDFFLSVEIDEDGRGGQIKMISETENLGYAVFYGEAGEVLAAVMCTYDPDAVIKESFTVEFIGDSVMCAPMTGATLEELTSGDIFDTYSDGISPVYHLRYTMGGIPMSISIPSTVRSHNVNPWSLQYYIRVNDTVYSETFVNDVLGGIELIDGGVVIYMEMPEGQDFMRGNINFIDADGTIAFILVCTMDLTGAE